MKQINSYKDLMQYEKSIDMSLDNCYFVGELILTEEELHNLVRYLRDFLDNHSLDKVKYSFLVALVNIAYFYYDEEGFWSHIIKIFNIEDMNISTSYIY